MSITRRGLMGWVAALFGGAAVAKVAREEPFSLNDAVESVRRNSQLPSHQGHMPVRVVSRAELAAMRDEHAQHLLAHFESRGYADAWDIKPIQEQLDAALRIGARHACIHSGWQPVASCSRCDEAWASWYGHKDKAPESLHMPVRVVSRAELAETYPPLRKDKAPRS